VAPILRTSHAAASACPAGGLHRAVPPQLSPASAEWLHEIKHDGFCVLSVPDKLVSNEIALLRITYAQASSHQDNDMKIEIEYCGQ